MPRVSRKVLLPKRLQTELQASIAFACYDSDTALKSGDSKRVKQLTQLIFDQYMPGTSSDSDEMSHIELFLSGSGVYKYLFEEERNNELAPYKASVASMDVDTPSNTILILPEILHGIVGKRITVSKGMIDVALLTRKNLTNFVDISSKSLFRHAKDVEANFKKAYAICIAADSPYKDFKGVYPSGHNRESYLEWLKESMKGESGRVLLQDKVDEDVVPEVTEDGEADMDGDNDASSNKESKESNDSYFKGFIAFSLWGYIPPDGGEIFQSSLIKVM